MSAIAGIIRFDGAPVAPGTIERVTDALATRGPDGSSHWTQGSIALGHRLLRTTPESQDDQMLLSNDGNLVMVMDGRLDNREQLRRELNSRGAHMALDTDAQLVLAAYQAWGENSPKHLLGDFVFAVYDKRQKSLFVARDHVGARPLYYVNVPEFFAFASDDESLLQIPGVSRAPCENMIAYQFLPELTDFYTNQSWLKDVRVMPAAHVAETGENGRLNMTEYWKPTPGEPSSYPTQRDCTEAFRDLFGQAVRCRMRGSGDVATLLSGGLDSAAIAATVARSLPKSGGQSFTTYSTVMENDPDDRETASIMSIAERVGSQRKEVLLPSIRGAASLDDLFDFTWQQAHPVDNSILLSSLMFLAAAKNDDRALMHGVSGDITTWVPPSFARYFLADGQWHRAWSECKAASRHYIGLAGSSPYKMFLRACWSAFAPLSVQHTIRRACAGGTSPDLAALNPSFSRRLQLVDRLQKQHASKLSAHYSRVEKDHAARLIAPAYCVAEGLTGYEHSAGRFGVELRDPWSDRRVLQFFLDLPIQQKIRDGWTKTVVRDALEEDLDPMVTRRKDKDHLGRQIKVRLMSASRPQLGQVMENQLDLIENYINPDMIQKIYLRYQQAENHADRELLFTIMTLVKWIERIAP